MTPEMKQVLKVALNAGNGIILATALIGIGYRRTLDRTARWLLAWIVVDAIVVAASIYGQLVYRNTQYAAHSWYPISAALALCLVASTLNTAQQRQAMHIAAGVVTSIIVGLMIWVEEFDKFSRFTGAIHGLTLLAAGSILVMARATKARGDMLKDQGFVIGAAFMLAGAPSALAAISARYFGPQRSDLNMAIYGLKFVLFSTACWLMVVVFHRSAHRRTAPQTGHTP